MKYNRMVIFQNVVNVEHNIQFWFNFREIVVFGEILKNLILQKVWKFKIRILVGVKQRSKMVGALYYSK